MAQNKKTDKPTGPLAGIRVLEIANVIAGPTACQILGDYGAEIIKIEHPEGGDSSRTQGGRKDGVPLWWKVLGRNKRSVGMYLGDPEAAEVFLELVKTADVVVEGFRAGTLEKWNLGYDRLSSVNPKIILARVSGFGQTGPYSHRPAFGTNIESLSGLPDLMGDPAGPPTMATFALGDYFAAVTLTSAISMALYHRDARGGTGQEIDLAILAPLIMLQTRPILHLDQLGMRETRRGNRSTGTAPRRAFKTKDSKWVNIAAATAETAARIMEMVERPEIANEPWFSSNGERLKHAELIDGAIERWVAERTRHEVMRIAERSEVTLAPMYDIEEMFNDVHVRTAGFITGVEDKDLGQMNMPNVLFKLSGTPGQIRWTGPELGDATKEVLEGELGLSAGRLEKLRQRKVLF